MDRQGLYDLRFLGEFTRFENYAALRSRSRNIDLLNVMRHLPASAGYTK